jgi:hypothetical protein
MGEAPVARRQWLNIMGSARENRDATRPNPQVKVKSYAAAGD